MKLPEPGCSERKPKTQGKDGETSTGTQTEAKKQTSTVEMSPSGDVAVATGSLRHNAMRNDSEENLTATSRRWKRASHFNAATPGPQQAPGYLNDDSNGL